MAPDALHGRSFMFSEPELQVRDLSQRPTVPGRHLDMLACRRLLKKSVDAPEVNENIWFLPDLFTSQLGHMSWQVTRVQRRLGDRSIGLFSLQHGAPWPHPRNTAEDVQPPAAGKRLTPVRARFTCADLHTDGRDSKYL